MQDGELIHAGFEARARAAPGALAVSWAGGELSYGRLDVLSRQLAGRIVRGGRSSGGEVVAILAERGPQVVVAMLACLRAGRPFVVLDLAYPLPRLRALLDVCRPGLLLMAGREAAGVAAACGLPALAVSLDAGPEGSAGLGGRNLPVEMSPDGAAYLLFTSGSTGTPKCVAVSHRPLVNFLEWQARAFGVSADDRFTMLSGLSHDPVLRDVFAPLSLGASVHVPAQAEITAPGELFDWFVRVQPTVAHMTPPLGGLLTAGRGRNGRRGPSSDPAPQGRLLPREEKGALYELRHVFWGGDVLRGALVEALAAVAPGARSVNFYGSTETPQAASFFRVEAGGGEERVPIGTGIDGFRIEVRGEDGLEAPAGEPGEIVVRSRFLTLGYVTEGRLPEGRSGDHAYATGDVGCVRADGQVVIQGRRDDQVKVRGFRVEMAEITGCALAAAGVDQAITLNIGSGNIGSGNIGSGNIGSGNIGSGNVGTGEDVRLACFVAPAGIDTVALRTHIAASLPPYMVPDDIVAMAELPLLPNGKVDRQALTASRRAAADAAPVAAGVEGRLVADWRRIFRRDGVDARCSFAGLGGDSLSYVNAYLSVEEALGRVPAGWTTMSIAELAAEAAPAAAAAKAGPARTLLADVESTMLLRALAISAVVASHYQLFSSGSGATSALIFISGCLFGSLQLHQADHQSSLKPMWRLLGSLLLPLAAIEGPQILVKFAIGYHAQWSSVLMYTDLIDYTGMPAEGPDAYGGHAFLMWYVHCLFHILVIYAALLAAGKYLLRLKRPAVFAMVAAVALGLAGRFVAPAVFVPGFLGNLGRAPIDPMSVFNHSPATHLATFALAAATGWMAGRWKWASLAMVLVYGALSAPVYGVYDGAAIAGVGALLLLAPKLRLPRVTSGPVYMVAGASLFIYLLHFKFLVVSQKLGLPAILALPVAIAGGVAVWRAWTWGLQAGRAWWAALRRARWGGWRYGAQGA